MRIVFLSYNYSPGIHSPQEWISRIQFYVGWLECLAREHTVIRVDQIDYEGTFDHNGILYHFVNDGKKKNNFPRQLNRFVKSLQPDIVVVAGFLYPLQVMQLRNCLGKQVRILVQHHSEKPFTGIKKYLQRLAYKKVDACLFTSRAIGQAWIKSGNISSPEKIYELMEVSSVFQPADKIIARSKTLVQGHPVFLWVVRLKPIKDPLVAVKAFLKFASRNPAARLYMIYQTTELLNEVKELLPSRGPVILVGKVAHEELVHWYNSADFFISASHYEGSGTALCEAMSCGCIPIVTDIPSFRTITANGTCGLLFQPGNEQELIAAMEKTATPDIESMRNRVLQQFNTNLSFEAIAGQFKAIIHSL